MLKIIQNRYGSKELEKLLKKPFEQSKHSDNVLISGLMTEISVEKMSWISKNEPHFLEFHLPCDLTIIFSW